MPSSLTLVNNCIFWEKINLLVLCFEHGIEQSVVKVSNRALYSENLRQLLLEVFAHIVYLLKEYFKKLKVYLAPVILHSAENVFTLTLPCLLLKKAVRASHL